MHIDTGTSSGSEYKLSMPSATHFNLPHPFRGPTFFSLGEIGIIICECMTHQVRNCDHPKMPWLVVEFEIAPGADHTYTVEQPPHSWFVLIA